MENVPKNTRTNKGANYSAKFYNLAEILSPGFKDTRNVNMAGLNDHVTVYIKKHKNIKTGDILFVGDAYRQEYGFRLVIKGEAFGGENITEYICKEKREIDALKELQAKNVKYKAFMKHIMSDKVFEEDCDRDRDLEYLFTQGEHEAIIKQMIDNNIY